MRHESHCRLLPPTESEAFLVDLATMGAQFITGDTLPVRVEEARERFGGWGWRNHRKWLRKEVSKGDIEKAV
jgi:hypothetical protein